MTAYIEYHVNLCYGQKANLARAVKNALPITLRLSKNELKGNDELMLTKTQINKIRKAIGEGRGVEISISKTQIRKAVKHSGSLWSSLISSGTKLVPFVTKGATKVAPHLETGALSALGSLRIDKIFGKGIQIPFNFLSEVAKVKELTKRQLDSVKKGLQIGRGINFKPSQKQINGGLQRTLATIGIPIY